VQEAAIPKEAVEGAAASGVCLLRRVVAVAVRAVDLLYRPHSMGLVAAVAAAVVVIWVEALVQHPQVVLLVRPTWWQGHQIKGLDRICLRQQGVLVLVLQAAVTARSRQAVVVALVVQA
jgi:hypothetical protein